MDDILEFNVDLKSESVVGLVVTYITQSEDGLDVFIETLNKPDTPDWVVQFTEFMADLFHKANAEAHAEMEAFVTGLGPEGEQWH